MPNKLLVVIAGSTAVGKTKVAKELAQHFNTEVVSADSRQVYRELNIGVGKPTTEELSKVKHHFIGHVSIHQPYTAAIYAKEAKALLRTLFEKHDIVILAGGTGLYIKALTQGFDDIPDVPQELFEKWQSIWEENGTDHLVTELKKKDPKYYSKVDHSNHTRLIRALSVIDATNRPFSDFLTGEVTKLPYSVVNIVLQLPREELYERINQRVNQMVEDGWIEEARTLYPHRAIQALQTVGYKELFEHFDGNLTLDEAIEAIQQSTRRYAKRQLTWWRNQGQWMEMHPAEIAKIVEVITAAQKNQPFA